MNEISADKGADARGSEDESKDRIPFAVCTGYGIGSLGISIMLNTITIFFPVLMTTVLGQSAALAGILLTVSKLYDVVADIVIGVASDKTRTRIGRRRPYLFAGAVVGAFSFFMIFLAPPMTETLLILYMGAALIIYSTGYSLFAVPYIAMAGEMTDGYHERTRLLSFRTFFVSIGQLLSAAGMAAIVKVAGGGSTGYAVMGAAAGTLVFTTMFISFLGTRRARSVERDVTTKPIPGMQQVKSLIANLPFMQLMGAKTFLYLAISVISTTKLLFLLNVLKVGYDGLVSLTVSQNVVAMFMVPVWTWAGRRFGKTQCYLAAIGILSLLYASYMFTTEGISTLELYIRGAINGVPAAGVTLMGISMLPDVMEYDRKVTGQRREGVYSSIYATMEKVAFAIGPGLVGVYLAAAGFVSTTGGEIVDQPDNAVRALYIGISAAPAILTAISFLIMSRYKLNEQSLRAMPEYKKVEVEMQA